MLRPCLILLVITTAFTSVALAQDLFNAPKNEQTNTQDNQLLFVTPNFKSNAKTVAPVYNFEKRAPQIQQRAPTKQNNPKQNNQGTTPWLQQRRALNQQDNTQRMTAASQAFAKMLQNIPAYKQLSQMPRSSSLRTKDGLTIPPCSAKERKFYERMTQMNESYKKSVSNATTETDKDGNVKPGYSEEDTESIETYTTTMAQIQKNQTHYDRYIKVMSNCGRHIRYMQDQ